MQTESSTESSTEPSATSLRELVALFTKLGFTAFGGPAAHVAMLHDEVVTRRGCERIARFAFDYAVKHGRRKVTICHKANILKAASGLFLETALDVSREYEGRVEVNDVIIDAAAMKLVLDPTQFDVIVTTNMFGDILSDEIAGLVGGLGLAPGANIGPNGAVFEATHGSAPKYKGQNRVNPTALILSGMLMLRYLKEKEAADRLEQAVGRVIAEGKDVTYDMKPHRDDPTAVGTREMAEAICRELAE